MTDFIPIFQFNSENINTNHTMYVNKNTIYAFSHFKTNDKECLLVKFDIRKGHFPPEYVLCKEENPVAFHELLKDWSRFPEKMI